MSNLTPVFSQIIHHHVIVVMENEKHEQTTISLDSDLKKVDEGEYGQVVRRCKERNDKPVDKRPMPLTQPPAPKPAKATP